jgi:hypothetical protein
MIDNSSDKKGADFWGKPLDSEKIWVDNMG